ncbi:FUSC family protein [Streptomyces rectiverticillatus]|uniref:FUSC family protein n=1 Tax=Streptomyces rectiverticillatus TaxID=173860 RepID=UPI0015C33A15|nr:FUSC family protein [Streptomyces rectiverticillatus]QLE74927.1 FUSC family protein [Streptomyces rectiverticillatus]
MLRRSPLPGPLHAALRIGRPADIWYKSALSGVVAMAVPYAALLAAGRLDLALYTSAGALCALFGHDRPYAARARTLALVVLGMTAGVGAALAAAVLTPSPAVLVAVAAVLAAAQKTACDAFRTGPPGHVVLTFVTASACFAPQRAADLPLHVGLTLACGLWAWLVCMAPALVRPHGPERIAAARALEAAARLARANTAEAANPADTARARHAAWQALLRAPATVRAHVHDELVRREAAGHGRGGTDADPRPAAGTAPDSGPWQAWARALRKGRALPWDAPAAPGPGAMPPGPLPLSLLLPTGARVLAGSALAGWASLACGVGHPYWAVVSAASVVQAGGAPSWQRALQRVLGNLLGVALFAALVPLMRTGQAAMVLAVLVLLAGAEALISRNYWLGTVCVTPMALLLTEFGGSSPAGELVGDRWTDTLVGAAAGLLACALVTNRRAADRVDAAVVRVSEAHAAALAVAAGAGAREADRARDRLAAALVDLREAADAAAGEWRRTAPGERVARAENDGHRALAALARGRAPGSGATLM